MKGTGGVLGAWIRQWRKDNRYTIGGLSDLSGISKAQLWELEKIPVLNPRLKTLMSLSKATGTPFTKIVLLAAQQALENNTEVTQ